MYVPKHFEETRIDVLHALIREHPLGTLVTTTSEGLEANHLPFEIVAVGGLGSLRGHVARANPVWKDTLPDRDALVVFGGPQAYISPAWYATKRETGKVVPTWNYAVVHAHGRLRAIEDEDWLRALVTRLTDRHEAARDDRWRVSDAPGDFVAQMLRAIVGVEIAITRIVGKWKVSQNRPERDRAGTAEGLLRDANEAARAMAALVRSAGR
jgi:transcriptional regulator